MKRKILAIALFCAFVLSVCALAACKPEEKGDITVTWYDATGTTDVSKMPVLKTEKVNSGDKLSSYTPSKDGGYEFVNWFAVPSKGHLFDFSAPITEDTAVYAGFAKVQNDTRTFYVLGNGNCELLFGTNWGAVITDSHKLSKAADKNEYTITMDLMKGDQFQFAIDGAWHNQRGFGYLVETALKDGTEVFSSNASPYTDAAKTANIMVEYAGNYTFTLRTYPGDDYYNTSAPNYTEETKETYNMGTYDTITWKRNGDVQNNVVTVTDFYIKGEHITDWADMYNPSTQMVRDGNSYTLSVWLKKDDQFMFTSRVTKIENGQSSVAPGSTYIKSNNLDAAARELIDGYSEAGANMKAKADGKYTFTYKSDTQVLSVAYVNETAAAMDYYLDGNIGAGNKWNAFVDSPAEYKLQESSAGSGVFTITKQLAVGQSVQIRGCAAGETPTTSNTANNLFQFNYVKTPGDSFEAMSEADNNIKVKVAGNYDISIDGYSKIITIVPHVEGNDTLDVYIKGAGINNWSHNFADQWKFTLSQDGQSYEFVLTVEEGATVEFGLEKFAKGVTEGYGTFINVTAKGTSGDANDKFVKAETSDNISCSTAGTYRIVFDIATEKVDFYAVQAD